MTSVPTKSGRARPGARRAAAVRLVVHALAALPAAWLAYHAAFGDLGFNPVDTVIRTTGKSALVVLVLSLVCTPLYRILGARWAIPLRRPLGLWAFAYAAAHLLSFVGLDYGFDLGFILADGLPKKPYIVVGLAAFALLVPLAATSTKGWQRRLGRRWTRLHRLVYGTAVLAAIHFFWVTASTRKGGSAREPYLWAAAVALLLVVRAAPVRAALARALRRPPAATVTGPAATTGG